MKRLVSLALVAAVWMAGATVLRAQNPVVILDTSKGKITIELDEKAAPKTVENFLKYVDDKHYDGVIFHRVIPGFMVQTGGFTDEMREKPTRGSIKNESTNGLQNRKGTLAMARTSDPDSASSQFFINVKDNDFLDRAKARDAVGYAVFGRVIDGMDVVEAIVEVPTTTRGGHENVPQTPILIRSAKRK